MRKINLALIVFLFCPQLIQAATYTVTTANDEKDAGACAVGDTDCSLREAIAAASLNPGADTIEFDSSLDGVPLCMTYTAEGDYYLNGELTIDGNGESLTIIDAGDTTAGGSTTCSAPLGERVFSTGGTVTLKDLTVKGGVASTTGGGGILVTTGSLIIEDCTVSGNYAKTGYGGGIYAQDNTILTLINSTVSQNLILGHGGGIYAGRAVLTVSGSSVIYNTTGRLGNGGGIFGSTMTIEDSDISLNAAAGGGGGIHAYNNGSASVDRTTISGNLASSCGGGIYINEEDLSLNDSSVTENTAVRFGGGIFHYDTGGTLTTDSSNISKNVAADGGGIYALSDIDLVQSVVSQNRVTGLGGGIASSSSMTLLNSSIVNNEANIGGGISFTATASISHSTIAGNISVGNGGGIEMGTRASLEILGSISAQNVSGIAGTADCSVPVGATFTSQGYNFIPSTECAYVASATDNNTGLDLNLDVLVTGTLPSLALLSGSAAIDAGTCIDIFGNPIVNDQRDVARDSMCDIGAYEYTFLAPIANAGVDRRLAFRKSAISLNGTLSSDPDGDPITYAWTVVSVPSGSTLTVANIIGPASSRGAFHADITGTYEFMLTVTDSHGMSSTDNVVIRLY